MDIVKCNACYLPYLCFNQNNKSMKIAKQTFLAILVAVISFVPASAADDDYIILNNKEDAGEVIHRSQNQIPILCQLLPDSIWITYLDDLGPVSIEVENQNTGEYNIVYANALIGTMALPISGSIGHWLIVFTLSSGTVFYGYFDIS